MQKYLTAFWQIVALWRKELFTLFKDPANRITLVAPALIQGLLFGYAATYDLTNVPYAVLDQSHSAQSAQVLQHLDGTGVFNRVATLNSASEIKQVIDDGNALLVLSFPSDFAEKLNNGQAAPLQVILDGRNSTTAGSASSYVANVVAGLNAKAAISVEKRVWYNPNADSQWSMMPALIASISLMQTLMIAALSVAREREQGTFDQLLVTPFTPIQILVGKALPSVLVGLIQSTILLLIIRFWFAIPMNGSVVAIYCGLVVFNVSAVGIGLCISAFSNTMQQAMLYTFVLVMPLMLLSGMLTSVKNMPEVLQIATYANPLRFAIEIIRRIYLQGVGLADVAVNFIPLGVIALITLPMAAWLFRNKLA